MSFRFDVITLFPELLTGYLEGSILGRAAAADLMQVRFTNPRDFTRDRHRTVDDSPFGGGAGMVMMAEPIALAVEHVRTERAPERVVLLGPAGRPNGPAGSHHQDGRVAGRGRRSHERRE